MWRVRNGMSCHPLGWQELGFLVMKIARLWPKASLQDVTFLEKGLLVPLAWIKPMLCLCGIGCQFPAAVRGLGQDSIQDTRPVLRAQSVSRMALNTGRIRVQWNEGPGIPPSPRKAKQAPVTLWTWPFGAEPFFHSILFIYLFIASSWRTINISVEFILIMVLNSW